MKDPSDVHFETDRYEQDGWPNSHSLCESCLTPWPCTKWEKWTKSDSYKIQVLESSREVQAKENLRQNKELAELRDKVYRLEVFVKGVMPALGDLLQGKVGGKLSYREDVDYIDSFVAYGHPPMRLAGLREFSVDYSGPDGSEYHNGALTEMNWRKP